jgi:hypothetical protein
VLTDTSGLGDIYIKDDYSCFVKMFIYLSIMLYIDYVTLIMSLWDLYYLVAMLAKFDMDSLLLFPTLQCVVRCCSEEGQRCSGVSRRLIEVLGICYPQSVIPEKNGA